MIKRILGGFAALTLALGVSQLSAAPAQATYSACSSGYVCFWDWIEFNNGGTFWSTHVQNSYGTCVNLPTSMRDKPSSIGYNRSVGGSTPDQIRFFLWVDCNAGGGYLTRNATEAAVHEPNLGCPSFTNPCSSFYNNNIVSFRYCNNGC